MTLFIHRGYDCIYIELLTILEIGLDHSVLLRLQVFPNRCTGSMQSLLKLQLFFGGLIYFHINIFSTVQLLSRVWLFATPWTAACQASLSITISWHLLKLMSIELVMPSNHLILWHPLHPPPVFNLSQHQGLFQWVSSSHQVTRVLVSTSASVLNFHSGLISFRMDWLNLLAVQGTLKSLFQHHSSKASILWHSAFFIVQLSYPYMTTGKTIALTRQTFVDKGMSLLFNMLSKLVIAFLPRSKHL